MIAHDLTPLQRNIPPRQRRNWLVPLLLVLLTSFALLVGCQLQNFPFFGNATPIPVTPTAVASTSATAPQNTQTPVSGSLDNPGHLLIWLPPQFDPESQSPAGLLIKNRLDAFQKDHADLTVEVRLKALDGRGGLLDSLANASMAAHGALPTLVALQYRDLESAALKGLLLPLEGKTQVYTGTDWLPYAAALGTIQNKQFGIPFAGDALALVYRPVQTPYPPTTWQELSSQNLPVIFPAADPDATVLTAIYLDAGGNLLDANGMPVLESAPLQKSLVILNNGTQSGAFPFWLSQFTTFSGSWNAYTDQASGYAIAWASQFLASQPADSTLATLPKAGPNEVTLAQGWVWCIPEMSTQSQQEAIVLAEYLSDPAFIDELDQAAGYLPVYASGLQTIQDPVLSQTLTDITSTAQVLPAGSTMNTISPILEDSSVQIIKMQAYYQQVLDQALNHFKK